MSTNSICGCSDKCSGQYRGQLTAFVSVFKAARAEFNIGIATAKSLSHSSLISFAALACSFATASSALTFCGGLVGLWGLFGG